MDLNGMSDLARLVREYRSSYAYCSCCDELELFADLDLRSAISLATLSVYSGRRHPHQCRLPQRVLLQAQKVLLASYLHIEKCRSFEELHETTRDAFGKLNNNRDNLSGAGPLYVYDVAHRIGHSMGISPEFVYLHAGTRDGARNLEIWGDFKIKGGKMLLSDFPCEMHCLTPAQVEDFLCIYKKCFLQFGN